MADAHNCGDSVSWHLDHLGATGFREIASGSVTTNSASPILLIRSQQGGGKGGGPVEISVKKGEFFQFAVMPKAHHGCDLSQVDLTISEVGGRKRSWDLATDVKDDLIEGNPNGDRYGNSPWYFYVVAEGRGRSVNLKPSVVLTAEGAAKVRKEIDTATAQVKSLTEEQAQLKMAGPYEVIFRQIAAASLSTSGQEAWWPESSSVRTSGRATATAFPTRSREGRNAKRPRLRSSFSERVLAGSRIRKPACRVR